MFKKKNSATSFYSTNLNQLEDQPVKLAYDGRPMAYGNAKTSRGRANDYQIGSARVSSPPSSIRSGGRSSSGSRFRSSEGDIFEKSRTPKVRRVMLEGGPNKKRKRQKSPV